MKNKFIKGNIDWYINSFSKFEKSLNGQLKTPIHRFRKAAIKKLSGAGFPTTKHEEWKYINLTPISEIDFRTIPAAPDLTVFSKTERLQE